MEGDSILYFALNYRGETWNLFLISKSKFCQLWPVNVLDYVTTLQCCYERIDIRLGIEAASALQEILHRSNTEGLVNSKTIHSGR
jgi:hypothetical protein